MSISWEPLWLYPTPLRVHISLKMPNTSHRMLDFSQELNLFNLFWVLSTGPGWFLMIASGFQHRILPIQADKQTGMVLVDCKWLQHRILPRQAAAPPHLESSTQLRTQRHVLRGATERSSVCMWHFCHLNIQGVLDVPPHPPTCSVPKRKGLKKSYFCERIALVA